MNGQNGLTERKQQILKAIINAHIAEGEPVGSKSIMQNMSISCSSATIRNEMAELEEMGYLIQPHASAGRIPSELGYRFYVDSLIEHYAMTKNEISQISNLLDSKKAELDQILVAASRLASSLTNYTGLAIKPKSSSVNISKFEAVYLNPTRFVLVMVTSSGLVKTKNIHLDSEVSQETVSHLSDALNRILVGRAAYEITLPLIMELEKAMGEYASMVNPIVKIVYEVMSEIDNGELKFSGIDHLLEYPEYNDKSHLQKVLGTLENKEEILDLVSNAKDDEVKVFIGSESSVKEMQNSAIAFKPIMKDGKTIGAIGVIGPVRMDYAKVMATLEEITDNIATMIDPGGAPEKKLLGEGESQGV